MGVICVDMSTPHDRREGGGGGIAHPLGDERIMFVSSETEHNPQIRLLCVRRSDVTLSFQVYGRGLARQLVLDPSRNPLHLSRASPDLCEGILWSLKL